MNTLTFGNKGFYGLIARRLNDLAPVTLPQADLDDIRQDAFLPDSPVSQNHNNLPPRWCGSVSTGAFASGGETNGGNCRNSPTTTDLP